MYPQRLRRLPIADPLSWPEETIHERLRRIGSTPPIVPEAYDPGRLRIGPPPQPGGAYDPARLRLAAPRTMEYDPSRDAVMPETLPYDSSPVDVQQLALRLRPPAGAEMPQQRLLPEAAPTGRLPIRGEGYVPPVLNDPDVADAYLTPRFDLSERLRAAQAETPAPPAPSPRLSRVQELLNAEAPNRPERREIERGGFLGTLKHIGKGALQGLALGGFGGAIGGAIRGGISPQSTEDIDYQLRRLPRWQAEDARVKAEAAHRLKLAEDYARFSGENPFTGKATPSQQRINELIARNDDLARQADEKNAQAWARIDQAESKAAAAEKRARIGQILSAARIPGRVFTQATRDELERLLGVTLPAEFNPQTHDVIEARDGSYQIVSIDRATGQPTVTPITTPDGKPLLAPEKRTAPDTNAARLAALEEWKRKYPNGKPTQALLDWLKSHPGESEETGARYFRRHNRNPYITDPRRDPEYEQMWRRRVQGGANAPASQATQAAQAALDSAIAAIEASALPPEKKEEAKARARSLHQQRWGNQ